MTSSPVGRVLTARPNAVAVIRRLALLAVLVASGCGSTGDVPGSGAGVPGPTLDPDSPYQTTVEDFFLRTKACVEEAGYPVEMDIEEQSFEFSLGSDELARQADVELKRCMREIDPRRLLPPPPLTADQLGSWYTYLKAQVACLSDAGYPVGSPPPEQVFIDSEGDWDPYQDMIEAGITVRPEHVQQCQQVDERPAFFDW
jgi:hypothetical protein